MMANVVDLFVTLTSHYIYYYCHHLNFLGVMNIVQATSNKMMMAVFVLSLALSSPIVATLLGAKDVAFSHH